MKQSLPRIARKTGVNPDSTTQYIYVSQLAKKAKEATEELDLPFFLKTQGRSRGYSEKVDVEHTGKDGGAIQFDVKQMTTDELRKIISSARDSITRISSQTDD
jgi:pyruvate-formate lyase-activating enzyme